MAKNKKRITLSLLFISILLMNADFVYALEVTYPKVFGLGIGNGTLPEYAKYFFNAGIGFAGALALLVVSFGAIYYLIDFATGKFASEGKEWIKAGIIGLLLTLSAYLIAFTINPSLVVFDLNGLAPLTFLANYFNPPKPLPPAEIYEEIPIGTLTENLLTREIDCYNYDGNGDPISGDKIITDNNKTIIGGPTYLEHDRVDCFSKLGQAASDKAKIIKNLSDQIADLMKKCSCEGTCNSDCNKNGKGCDNPPKGSTCTGSCVNGKCEPPDGKADCCPADSGVKDPKNSKKNLSVKDLIEHGPITLTDCYGQKKDYAGLDEFRTQYNSAYPLIKIRVEVLPPPEVNKKQITVIDNGNCKPCEYNCSCSEICPVCDPEDNSCIKNQKKCEKDNQTCKNNQSKCQEDEIKCESDYKTCMQKNSPWYNLRLIDQLAYFQGKITDAKAGIQEDLNILQRAETSLSQCYLADTYVDFLKTYNQTNKDNKTILVVKPYTVNPSKYCKGFEFNNSTCYSQCQKVCPGTPDDLKNYGSCKDCSGVTDYQAKEKCIAEQAVCVKKYYDTRNCIPGASPFNKFADCMTGCKQQCTNLCSKKCGADKEKCLADCNTDSQCLANNEDKCLVNFTQLYNCTSESFCESQCNQNESCVNDCKQNYNDPDFIKNCIDTSASLCKYCSDQYAGYADCLNSPYSLQGNYSSSDIYKAYYVDKNEDYQICNDPNKNNFTSSAGNSNSKNTATCLASSPETAKCPDASKCPECPCGISIESPSTQMTSSPNQAGTSCGPKTNSSSSGGSGSNSSSCQTSDPTKSGYCAGGSCVNGSCSTTTSSSSSGSSSGGEIILPSNGNGEYRVCSNTCDTYFYNDDPLTFYCQQSWWLKDETKNSSAIGADMVCDKDGEIPVGQTVDDSETWAKDFIDNIDKIDKKVQDLLQYMQLISRKTGYCSCSSVCENNKPACHTSCSYTASSTSTDAEGNVTKTPASCSFVPCKGNPCQVMLDLLLGSTCSESCASGYGIAFYYGHINDALKAFLDFTVHQSLSDILKELNYSRQKTNQCSTIQNNYGTENRILSCTRVEDEIISPIVGSSNPAKTIINGKSTSSYCYGKELGDISGDSSLTDNWFCCQQIQKGGTKK
jgi:hypothetical protein